MPRTSEAAFRRSLCPSSVDAAELKSDTSEATAADGRWSSANLVNEQDAGGVIRSGLDNQTRPIADTALITHRVSPTVTIAAPDGKHTLIPHTNIAQAGT